MTQNNIGFENADSFTQEFGAQFSKGFKGFDNTPLNLDWFDTPMGMMLAICDDTHLFMLEFTVRKAMQQQFEKLHELSQFKTPLMPTGTEFQTATWQQLCNIPHGETRSYAQLANMVGNPKAVRAVASANARNGLALIIPCHRVIGSDGGLGGYARRFAACPALYPLLEGRINPQ